jgi:hypothetical protein
MWNVNGRTDDGCSVVTIAKKGMAFYYAKQSWEKRSFFFINSLKEYLDDTLIE